MELMDYGSLYDLLHNDSMAIEGEIILPILKDIAQGLRFLHSADPLIVHGLPSVPFPSFPQRI